jgi:hypothetical protein
MIKANRAHILLVTLVVLLAPGTRARAQAFAIGPGSTLAGDYLRGAGFAAWGEGMYNLYTAQAISINTDTYIRWNEYVQEAYKLMSKEYNERNRAIMAKTTEALNKRRERMLNSPEELDLMKGDALNLTLEKLLDPRLSDSSFRSAKVPLPVDLIRRIPFKLGEKGERFSMERLQPQRREKWPVAMQDPQFDLYRKAYDRAIDKALEQAIEGKAEMAAIDEVDKAVNELEDRVRTVVPSNEQRLQSEAIQRLRELRATVRLFQTHTIQMALGEIARYGGDDVDYLRRFMQKYNLRFAGAETPDERKMFPDLYTRLDEQRSKVVGPALGAEK